MPLEADILQLYTQQGNVNQYGVHQVPEILQGITINRIAEIMLMLDINNDRINRAIYSLLDNNRPSWYRAARVNGLSFSDGAQQAHISCHVGILQEPNPIRRRKIDREQVRDYVILPLIRIGIVERVFHQSGEFLDGHPRANSSSNCYRLNQSFIEVLQTSRDDLPAELENWASQENERRRAVMAANALAISTERVGTPHARLIEDAAETYAPRFLPGYQVVFIDVGDGTRVTEEDELCLADAGLGIERGDAMPDILLWNPESDQLWVIEAVISDGEVDSHKVARMDEYCERYNKSGISYTTAYPDWRTCGRRQNVNRNIHPNSYIWIRDDPSKQYFCAAYEEEE